MHSSPTKKTAVKLHQVPIPGPCRVIPVIGVRIGYGKWAKAHIRKRGSYQYLSWRDGDTVKEFYLGRVRP